MWVKLFLNNFYFSKKTLYTVLFLYFSLPTCSFALIYCYFFIIIIDKSTTSFTKCKNDSAFLLRDTQGCRAIVPTLDYWKTQRDSIYKSTLVEVLCRIVSRSVRQEVVFFPWIQSLPVLQIVQIYIWGLSVFYFYFISEQ